MKAKIIIEIKDTKLMLEENEAKELYQILKKLVGEKDNVSVIPWWPIREPYYYYWTSSSADDNPITIKFNG